MAVRALIFIGGMKMPKAGDKIFLHALYILTLLFCIATGIILLLEEKNGAECSTFLDADSTAVLIIDAGHGGADGGAVAADGSKESLINLKIAEKLESAAAAFGISTIMTRNSEELPYPESADTIAAKKKWDQNRRLDLINSQDNAVYISIHQNYYPDPRPVGPQVLFGLADGSEALGNICHEMLNSSLCPDNRRVASPVSDKIFLMNKTKCTAILVECGFLSNPDELLLLKEDTYQKKLAAILLASYLCYIG